jgi:hypothetical protein
MSFLKKINNYSKSADMAEEKEENSSIVKIVIPREELESVKNKLTCNQIGCTKTFTSSSNLNMHLWKTHKIDDKKPPAKNGSSDTVQFHCPENSCKYSLDQGRYFSQVKLLKQVSI